MDNNSEMADVEIKRHGSSAGSLFTGFLIGGLAGIIAAFLIAPQSGEETRFRLRDKGLELKDRALTTMDETRTRAEQALADTKVRAGEKLQDISSRAEEVARSARRQAEDMTRQAEAERADSQSSIESGL